MKVLECAAARQTVSRTMLFLMIVSVGVLAYFSISYINQPLLEDHGFRQTQTALTSFWMMKEGLQLAYETPVVGYPWSIPFEFPLFQAIAAATTSILPLSLDASGRLVSVLFLLGCAAPAIQIANRLKVKTDTVCLFLALLWTSPIYMFWARTFMIETCALFLALMAMVYALDLRAKKPRINAIVGFAFWASLGLLQKATTAAPVLLICGVLVMWAHVRLPEGWRFPPLRTIAAIAAAFALPLFIGLGWAHYTDVVKSRNDVGAMLTSSSLMAWNFGGLDMRFDGKFWHRVIFKRVWSYNAGGVIGVLLVAWALWRGDPGTRKLLLSCLALFIAPIAIFSNLHNAHSYYQTSCAVFLVAAVALAVDALGQRLSRRPVVAVLSAILLVVNIWGFSKEYLPLMASPLPDSGARTLTLAKVIQDYTPETSGIVVFGIDWTSEIAYYGERRSMTYPEWFSTGEQFWSDPDAQLGGLELGAAVFCDVENEVERKALLSRPTIQESGGLYPVEDCFVWLPKQQGAIRVEDVPEPVLAL